MQNNLNNDKAITLTLEAAQYMSSNINKSADKVLGIKFGVKLTGCSGYAYTLEFISMDKQVDLADYKKFSSHQIDIYVDNASYEYLAGTVIDYKLQGLTKSVVFYNPNVAAECGCGESFTVDQNKKRNY
jgi:iron-sulfur cluster assembly protein